jgi:hypothetical protein
MVTKEYDIGSQSRALPARRIDALGATPYL